MNAKEFIAKLKWQRTAFRHTFNGPDGSVHDDGRKVLQEIRRFCYGNKPTLKLGPDGSIDPYASIAAAARQEVYFRIIAMLDLNDEDLVNMEHRANVHELGAEHG